MSQYIVTQVKRTGLELWVIFDQAGNELGSAWSKDGAERRVMQLLRKPA